MIGVVRTMQQYKFLLIGRSMMMEVLREVRIRVLSLPMPITTNGSTKTNTTIVVPIYNVTLVQ